MISLAELLAPGRRRPRLPDQQEVGLLRRPLLCRARYNGIDQPRRALSQLVEVRELSWSKRDTECCGGGGLLRRRSSSSNEMS
ncbi:MAG: hypothetical protein QM765_25795, partial [Myxococcales bacterium]